MFIIIIKFRYVVRKCLITCLERKLNYDEIKKIFPRTLKTTKIPVYMIEYRDKPLGIIQYKLVEENYNWYIYW